MRLKWMNQEGGHLRFLAGADEYITKSFSPQLERISQFLEIRCHLSGDINPTKLKEERLTKAMDWLAPRIQERYALSVDVQADGSFTLLECDKEYQEKHAENISQL